MMDKNLPVQSDFLLYSNENGDVKVETLLFDETVWLTQQGMAELFGKSKSTINEHINNVFKENELEKDRVMRKFGNSEFTIKPTNFYNLDLIISVGYRVKSVQGTRFRIWATQKLREYIIKGFVLDGERLKNGSRFGKDYFDELLEKIREVRASERRFYQKITDIYKECSIDYDPKSEITQTFYATVQNKLEWAITGMTSAELISARVDSTKPNMNLSTWKNSPKGKILKSDTIVAKNYMNENEIRSLERIVSMYLDYAENQAERKIAMKMADWVTKLDAFLQFNDYEILKDAGRVSREVAKSLAEKEYEKFRVLQDQAYESDFDKAVKKLSNKRDKK